MVTAFALLIATLAAGADTDAYYRVLTLPTPEAVPFEVGGLETLEDGRVAAGIRKGEVWVLENPYADPPVDLDYRLVAEALHEPLGLYRDGADLLLAQRAEVTRLRDRDGDGVIDAYLTEGRGWGLTGNYHEYAYGPERDGEGRLWVTLNQSMGPAIVADDAWRGWGVVVNADRSITPMCAGMRSPCGIGTNAAGDIFFTDQQGNWVPTNALHQLREGAFYGHVDSLKHCKRPESPIPPPESVVADVPLPEARARNPFLSLPAVWFPYRKMGMSATDILCDQSGGNFGPFEGQLFVGDFTMAQVNRVFLEQVGGEYQGACFPFIDGLQSAVVRMAFGADGSMFIGETNRGWNSTGRTSYGLERIVWTGETPFEILSMHAEPDGFRLRFTQPVDPTTAADPASYTMTSYTYRYHQSYGSEETDTKKLMITRAEVSEDQREVRLHIEGLREAYVHEIHAQGVKSSEGTALIHPEAYYTLNQIPQEN